MAQKIQRLSQSVIDSIAAGEVLERPANLVKELVENSLDAGATEIEVEIDEGGRRLRVTDNGHGMGSDDLLLALERHATSKIKNYDDLWALHTFGFRGEALASVAAVSRLTLISRTAQSNQAHRIESQFGNVSAIDQIAGPIGTTIQISELFANVPARLKFLKSDSAEIGQIRKVMKALALSQPQVTFKVKSRGELLHYWHAVASETMRAEQVLEKQPLYFAEGSSKNISVEISFAAPDKGQRTGQNIWLFAQDRWIQDKTLFAAVMDAYRSLLMHGEFPSVVVKVECAPGDIDVNVHPTKAQVKFRDGHGVFQLIHHTLRSALEKAPWAPHSMHSLNTLSILEPQQTELNSFGSAPSFENRQSVDISSQETLAEQGTRAADSFQRTQFRQKSSFEQFANPPAARDEFLVRDQSSAYEVRPYWANLQILGQANLTYIVAQSRQSLILVDQHAAHERVAYERLMQAWRDEKKSKIEVQPYLLPLSLSMQPEELENLMAYQEEFERLHISIDQGGPSTLVVRAAPSVLKESAIKAGLLKVAAEISSNQGSFAFDRMIGDLCATLACHSVVRAGQSLSHDEMHSLLSQMDEFPLSGFCPHGRPVYVEHTFTQMDRQFGRIV